MTKTIAERSSLALLLLLWAGAVRAAEGPPSPKGRVLEYEASQRLLGRWKGLEPMVDATERWQYEHQKLSRSLMAGAYWRVERHLKVGAFYRLQYGVRHDDDWFRNTSRVWSWRDSKGRPEHVIVLDATPRTQLSFLPGGSWVGSLKVRLEHNTFNRHKLVRVAPELAWFKMSGLTPQATVFLRHETVFPLNFGETTVWERWYYLAALWHVSPHWSLGPSVALREEVWSTSSAFRSVSPRDAGYQTLYRAWVPGFTVTARLP